jgi:hypothetical protein
MPDAAGNIGDPDVAIRLARWHEPGDRPHRVPHGQKITYGKWSVRTQRRGTPAPAGHVRGASPQLRNRDPMLKEVAAAYRSTRDEARLMSTIRLRWQERRMARHTEHLDQPSLACLAAIRDELRDRGCSTS